MKLAEEFLVIPYPFSPDHRRELEAEYSLLLDSGVTPREVTDMILYSLEILLHKRKKASKESDFNKYTFKVSDMLGRLLVFEELLMRNSGK